jgi:glutaredoxin-like protein NrdH
VKEFLSRVGVPFVEKNVEDDDAAYRELMARGVRTVPLTVSGDQAVKGFNEAELRRLIASGAPPSPDR